MTCAGNLSYRCVGTSSSVSPFCTWAEDEGGRGAEEAYSIVEPVGGDLAEECDPDRAVFSARATAGGDKDVALVFVVGSWWVVGGGMGLAL